MVLYVEYVYTYIQPCICTYSFIYIYTCKQASTIANSVLGNISGICYHVVGAWYRNICNYVVVPAVDPCPLGLERHSGEPTDNTALRSLPQSRVLTE